MLLQKYFLKGMEMKIIQYIMYLREERKVSPSIIRVHIAALKHFFEMNDFIGMNSTLWEIIHYPDLLIHFDSTQYMQKYNRRIVLMLETMLFEVLNRFGYFVLLQPVVACPEMILRIERPLITDPSLVEQTQCLDLL